MAAVRPLREVRVWSPDRERCAAFVKRATEEFGVNAETGARIAISAAARPRDAVAEADIICAVCAATTPVIESSWIRAGTHINAVGAHRPHERELDSATIQRARVFVDYMPSAMEEAGDILIPIGEHLIDRTHVLGDLTSLVTDRVPGRADPKDVTIFKSVGLAIEDIAAAAHAHRRALATGAGRASRTRNEPFDLTRRDFVQRLAALGGASHVLRDWVSIPRCRPRQAHRQRRPPERAGRALTLWYRRPASRWVEALPIGNGRLGAMIFGGIGSERLQLNEDTLWSGGPKDWDNPKAKEILPELRRLIAAGQYADADTLAKQALGPYTQTYLPLGDLHITFTHGDVGRRYRRALDLRTGIAMQQYAIGAVTYTREAIASHPDGIIAMRLAADRPGLLAFSARLTSPLRYSTFSGAPSNTPNTLQLNGRAPSHVDPNYYDRDQPVLCDDGRANAGMHFAAHLGVMLDGGGQARIDRDGLHVEGATEAIVLIAAATSFNGFDRSPTDPARDPAALAAAALNAARAKSWIALRDAHVADNRMLLERVELQLAPVSSVKTASPTSPVVRPLPHQRELRLQRRQPVQTHRTSRPTNGSPPMARKTRA